MSKPNKQEEPYRIVFGQPMQDYLSAPGIASHMLDWFQKSAAYYRDMVNGDIEQEREDYLDLGSAVHSILLENRRIHEVKPATYTNEKGEVKPWNGNSNTCKAWLAEHANALVLTQAQDEWCDAVQAMVLADSRCSRIMIAGKPEVSFYSFDPHLHVKLKARPDWCNLDDGIFANVKTTVDASTESLSRQILKYRWHVQAAMAKRCALANGCKFEDYYIIAIEKSTPPRLNVRRLSLTAIDRGMQLLEKNLEGINLCVSTEEWPDYSGPGTGIGLVDIPAYAYNDPEPMELRIQGAGFAL